ncbi:MAG: alpha/beta fold hydrolase [Planctomycetes bacterium]|nr:alpha/beta fold hydrolase [Planctomycetota bacterium]
MHILAILAVVFLTAALLGGEGEPGDGQRAAKGRPRLTAYRDALEAEGLLRDVHVDGYRYCVADAGKGPALVLLHGVSGSLYDWRHVIGPLRKTHRVIAIDLLGAGESDMPRDADYSLAAQARRVRGILDALGIEKAAVAGNSYGGGVALVFAQDWPERVERLVLINSICYADKVPAYARLARIPGADLAAEAIRAESSKRWFLRHFSRTVRRLRDEEIETYLKEASLEERRRSLIHMLRDAVPKDARELERRIGKIEAPALLIWGKADRTVPVELGRRLAKELPDATLVELDAGHIPNQEAPAEVLRHMEGFLRTRERV